MRYLLEIFSRVEWEIRKLYWMNKPNPVFNKGYTWDEIIKNDKMRIKK